ncbi:hypothetical protein WR25_14343 [Diploscapter pachys]|uniref:UDP-glucuronosyltransferase n=1 Tax=Diploscapter pachys TaxID=2018661 RepID=A0A2A2KH73_9BILA|nr:hypothetical protein WR25_14343 [Diploscapter pachys]
MLVGNKETEMYRQVYGHSFPDLYDVARECPLAMLNSNEMFEFPRPLMAKFVYIGGLGMGIGNETRSPLNLDFKKLVDESKSIVVFTFGSIAPAYKMPDDWKEAFWGAFKDLSEHTFIMRYEKPEELVGKLPSNVHAFKWIPQTDLLLQPKTKLLITHGGYNSLQEAISTAVPVVAIPLFGDQPKNGKIIESRHFGVTLKKSEIQRDKIREAIKTVVEDESYKKSITRVRQMIKKRPVSAEDLLIRWTEFVGEFKTLENLKPKAQDLSFIVHHNHNSFRYHNHSSHYNHNRNNHYDYTYDYNCSDW